MGLLDWLQRKAPASQDIDATHSTVSTPSSASDLQTVDSAEIQKSDDSKAQPAPLLSPRGSLPPVTLSDFNWNEPQIQMLRALCEWQLAKNRILTNLDEIRAAFPAQEAEIRRYWPNINMLLVDLSRYMFVAAIQSVPPRSPQQ